MEIDKTKTVAFTGYRTAKLLRSNTNPAVLSQLSQSIESTVIALIEKGYTTFLSGMAEGFDLMAASAVLRLKIKHPDIRLVAVIPFMGQELGYNKCDLELYRTVYELADKVVFTSDAYGSDAYFKRNDYMLDHSSAIVCYYDGQRGGTMYTYNRAIKLGLCVVNLCQGVVN